MTDIAQTLGRIIWHELVTDDTDAAAAFYEKLLPEWSLSSRSPNGGQAIEVNGLKVGTIAKLDAHAGQRAHWSTYVSVMDCETTLLEIEEMGGTCVVPTFDQPGVGQFASIADPQGAVINPFQLAVPADLPKSPAVGQFCWDELRIPSVDDVIPFYGQVFGWSPEVMDLGEDYGEYTIFQRNQQTIGGAVSVKKDDALAPCWLPYVDVGQLDPRVKQVQAAGGKITEGPAEIPDIGRYAIVEDPTGGHLALFEGFD